MFLRIDDDSEIDKLVQKCIQTECKLCVLKAFCCSLLTKKNRDLQISIDNPELLEKTKHTGFYIKEFITHGMTSFIQKEGVLHEQQDSTDE